MNGVSLETGEIVQVKFSFLHLCDVTQGASTTSQESLLTEQKRETFFQLEELTSDFKWEGRRDSPLRKLFPQKVEGELTPSTLIPSAPPLLRVANSFLFFKSFLNDLVTLR